MKKAWIILLSCMLMLGLTAGTVAAKPDQAKGQGSQKAGKASENKSTSPGNGDANGKNKPTEKTEKTDKQPEAAPAGVTEVTYGEVGSSNVGKGHRGYKGLLNAIQNKEGKHAGAVLANLLLTSYSDKLTPEQIAEVEQIEESAKALEAAADLLAENGSVTDAVYVQQEAVLADVSNLKGYQKLGELSRKAGSKAGMKLFVNGREAAAEPINRGGTTLVPFRAASEALNADVAWNPQDKSVTVTRGESTVKLYLDSRTAYVNGQPFTLDQPAESVEGLTLVPVRVISEALGATVQWEPTSQSVVVYEEADSGQ
ncbi:copper amine oxidase N-terminal domain-containing protein [Paenibacillus terreus]|uniref:Copper amine oxidase N-terminal domain-containing protein n=1 Tax=Paenibacillus terreus TaxID=1387834 RepID=A0ABV5BEX7_9BACL